MRTDEIGLFWQDEKQTTKGGPVRKMPKIKSKWRAKSPADWPNYRHAKKIAIDTETYDPNLLTHGPGWARGDGHLVGISAAVSPSDYIYLPMRHEVKSGQNCDPDKVLLWAKDNLQYHTNNKRLVIGANLIYDIGWLREEGVLVGGDLLDVQHVETLIDENLFTYNLDSIAQTYLKTGKISSKLYKWLARFYGGKAAPNQRKNIYRAPPSLVGPYAEGDAWQPYQIWEHQKKIIKEQDLERVLDVEMRLIPMLLEMRFRGVRVDLDYVEQFREELFEMEIKVQKKLNKVAKGSVVINSGNSIAKAFRRLGIPYQLTDDGNPSFVKAWLNAHPHKIAKLIVQTREIQKLRSTFIEGALLDKQVNGRIFGQFNQLRARSGRFSSSNPNLQQVPSRTELGRKVRRCFIPDEGYTDWYRYDYSQIEYRHLAHHAVGKGAKKIRKRYRKNPKTDYHNATTELIKEITNIILDRKPTKTINFGLCYGMGKPMLCISLGLSKKAGNNLFSAYHTGVPFVSATFDHFMTMAQEQGYVTTTLGRRSRFTAFEQRWGEAIVFSEEAAIGKWGRDNYQRAMCHKGLNRVLQGGAADHMKMAMVELWESGVFDSIGVPSLTVHDELDGSTNFQENIETHREIKRIMENCLPLKVPVIADVEVGPNWRDCKVFNF